MAVNWMVLFHIASVSTFVPTILTGQTDSCSKQPECHQVKKVCHMLNVLIRVEPRHRKVDWYSRCEDLVKEVNDMKEDQVLTAVDKPAETVGGIQVQQFQVYLNEEGSLYYVTDLPVGCPPIPERPVNKRSLARQILHVLHKNI